MPEPEPFTRTYRVAMGVCTPLRLWGRMKVEGLEVLPGSGPVLVVANHDSRMDPIVIGVAARRQRQIRALAKSDLWKVRGLGPILNGMGQIPIERAAGDAGALVNAIAALREGQCVGVFPEGTITVGRKLRARSGIGRLALEVPEAKLVCVAHTGTPAIARFPERPEISLRFFEPASGQTQPGETPEALSKRLLDEIRAIAPQVDAGRDPAKLLERYERKAEEQDARRAERADQAEREGQSAE